MIATVDIADLGTTASLRAVMRAPRAAQVPGLRSADVFMAGPLAMDGPPPLGRVGLIAFWDDLESAERFRADHRVARAFAGGLRASLSPLRAHGAWPGLPESVSTDRAVPHEGPVVVLTLARVRASQVVRFLKTSRPAEQAVLEADGLLWATGGARPPFVATVSVWETSKAAMTYAYGRRQPAHSEAMVEQSRKDFHRSSAFIRLAPLSITGSLGGDHPFDAAWVAPAV